jgi:hypothetical protein
MLKTRRKAQSTAGGFIVQTTLPLKTNAFMGTDLLGNFINARGVIIENILRSTHQNLRVPSVCLRDKRAQRAVSAQQRSRWCCFAAVG